MMAEAQVSETTQESNEPDPVEVAAVTEASGQGWVPKERFKGDEKDWVDAQTFVKRGREILPILRKNNENLLKELSVTKESLKQLKLDAEEFKKFQKDAYERKARSLEDEVTALKSARAQAITDGDGARANALDDAIDSAKEEVKQAKESVKELAKPAPPTPQGLDPKLQVWLGKNEWFGKDAMMTSITNAIGETLRTQNPGLMGDAFLERLDEALGEKFPELQGKPKRTPNFTAEAGSKGTGRSSSSKKSYENLPTEAKAACDRFVKQKLMTKEQYVSDFDWSE